MLTYEEAKRIRAQQLQGAVIAPALVEEALRVIKDEMPAHPHGPRSLPRQMLAMLSKGPMERQDFYSAANQLYERAGRSQGAKSRIQQFTDEGLIVDEVRLTAKGVRKLAAGTLE